MSDFSQRVKKWLDTGADYNTGVRLLAEVDGRGIRRYQKFVGQKFIPQYWRDKLRLTLAPHAAVIAMPEPPANVAFGQSALKAHTTGTHSAPIGRTISHIYPPEVQSLIDRNAVLHRMQTRTKTLLHEAKEDKERTELSRQLMEVIIPELDANHASINAFEKDGTMPPIITPPTIDGQPSEADLLRKLQSARSSRSRWMKQIKANKFASVAERTTLEEKITTKTDLINDLEIKLGINV